MTRDDIIRMGQQRQPSRRTPSHGTPQALQPAQAPIRTMADLRPNAAIKCLYCNQQRPQAGAQKFRAHHVCRECVTKLQTKDAKP